MKLALIITTALGFSNTPYPNKLTVWPALQAEKSLSQQWSVVGEFGARTAPSRINSFNPRSAHWDVGITYKVGHITLNLGHRSGHAVNRADSLEESFDYIRVRLDLLE